MTVLKRMLNWVSRQRLALWRKPSNGRIALKEIEPILLEMRKNNARVHKAVEKMVVETEEGKRIMANDHIINHNRT